MRANADVGVPLTNFAAFDDTALLWMLHRGAPETVRDIAASWGMVATLLQERATDLELEHRRLKPVWVSAAAEQFEVSIHSVIQAIRTVAEMAGVVRDIMLNSADALDQAKGMYPPPSGFIPARDAPAMTTAPLPASAGDAGLRSAGAPAPQPLAEQRALPTEATLS